MNNKKQNSIDWLIEQMIKYELVPKGIHFDNILFHQAKAMHKEEIMKSNRDGVDMVIDKKPYVTGEEYYKETFGGQDNE